MFSLCVLRRGVLVWLVFRKATGHHCHFRGGGLMFETCPLVKVYGEASLDGPGPSEES